MSVKTSHVVVGLVLAAGTVGLVVGTRGTRVTAEARHQTLRERAAAGAPARTSPESATPEVTPALTWSELANTRRGPNAAFKSHLAHLSAEPPAPELLEGRDARLIATREARAARRAYDGAPPRVPHTIDERSTSACLACHAEGLVIAERVAPRMSHPVYQNCTQCHVAEETPGLERATSPSDNTFIGTRPHPGFRFLPGSPPVMPHPRWMRETCASCHGPLGPPGLRTTHPERQSCEQCHVPAPSLMQEVFFR